MMDGSASEGYMRRSSMDIDGDDGVSPTHTHTLPAELEAFTDRQLATIREAFMAFAHDGNLARSDLALCLRTIGYHPSEVELRRACEELGIGSRLDYLGFLNMVARQNAAIRSPAAMNRAFGVFDPDGKGYVTAGEFRKIMEKHGEAPLLPATVDALIEYADPEDTGQIYYGPLIQKVFTEFAAWEKAKAAAVAAAKAAKK